MEQGELAGAEPAPRADWSSEAWACFGIFAWEPGTEVDPLAGTGMSQAQAAVGSRAGAVCRDMSRIVAVAAAAVVVVGC